jgi:hypothetical protein
MSAVSSIILEQLRAHFDVVIPGEREIKVRCPMCVHRGMGEDGSGRSAPGHLSLNFEKNVAWCHRCGYAVGSLRRWLRNRHFDIEDVVMSPSRGRMDRDQFSFAGEEAPLRLIEQELKVPVGCSFIDESDRTSWPFAESLLDKNITWEQIVHHNLQYSIDGRLAGYVMFPFFEDEVFVYYQGRATWKELTDDPSKSKYNPSNKEAPLGKTSWLYGVDDAIVGGDMFICEGTLDRITLHDFVQADIGPNAFAVSLQGTSLGMSGDVHPLNTQFGKIVALQPRIIGVLFDGPKQAGDKGAYGKAVKLAKQLCESGFDAFAGKLPFGDPNELADRPDILRAATTPHNDEGWAESIDFEFQNQ